MNRMPENKTNFISIMLPVVILMLLACTGHQLEVKPISKSENPQELINQLDNDIALAYKNQLNVLAPTWFGRADSSLNEAKKGLEKGGFIEWQGLFKNDFSVYGMDYLDKKFLGVFENMFSQKDIDPVIGHGHLPCQKGGIEALKKNDIFHAKLVQK